jgi:hypothetical protein
VAVVAAGLIAPVAWSMLRGKQLGDLVVADSEPDNAPDKNLRTGPHL